MLSVATTLSLTHNSKIHDATMNARVTTRTSILTQKKNTTREKLRTLSWNDWKWNSEEETRVIRSLLKAWTFHEIAKCAYHIFHIPRGLVTIFSSLSHYISPWMPTHLNPARVGSQKLTNFLFLLLDDFVCSKLNRKQWARMYKNKIQNIKITERENYDFIIIPFSLFNRL